MTGPADLRPLDDAKVAAVLAFHIAGRLTRDQVSGIACVWCDETLRTGAGISLGGERRWRPHACVPCYNTRSEWVQAYVGWSQHFDSCPTVCGLGRPCEVMSAFQVRVIESGRCAGSQAPACVRCRQSLQEGDVFRPAPWEGNSGPMYSFVHVLKADCTV